MILIGFIDGAFLIRSPPRPKKRNILWSQCFLDLTGTSHNQKNPSMDERTRAYFFTVPSWMGANHFLCKSVKILPVLFSSSYSVVWNLQHPAVWSLLAFGQTEISFMLN
jgi:hypothetical protein